MEYQVFISYSRKDSDVANRVYQALDQAGISCFIDLEGISGGANFPTILADAIMASKVFLFIASDNSYKSEFAQKELTFAVSNKGSRFIFPLKIDDTPLPKNIEFLISDINWPTLSNRYRIETDLVEDIQAKLKDPHAGETLQQKEKNTTKIVLSAISFLVIIVVAIVLSQTMKQAKQTRLQKEQENAAMTALRDCENWKNSANLLMDRADSLMLENNSAQTFQLEFDCMNDAGRLLKKADSTRQAYRQGPYRNLFSDFSTAQEMARLSHKTDSMFAAWSQLAKYTYEIYNLFPDEDTKNMTLRNIDVALVINPYDSEMKGLRATLTEKQ